MVLWRCKRISKCVLSAESLPGLYESDGRALHWPWFRKWPRYIIIYDYLLVSKLSEGHRKDYISKTDFRSLLGQPTLLNHTLFPFPKKGKNNLELDPPNQYWHRRQDLLPCRMDSAASQKSEIHQVLQKHLHIGQRLLYSPLGSHFPPSNLILLRGHPALQLLSTSLQNPTGERSCC